jgi:hypothetical protein
MREKIPENALGAFVWLRMCRFNRLPAPRQLADAPAKSDAYDGYRMGRPRWRHCNAAATICRKHSARNNL